jgi:hypothetical protein
MRRKGRIRLRLDFLPLFIPKMKSSGVTLLLKIALSIGACATIGFFAMQKNENIVQVAGAEAPVKNKSDSGKNQPELSAQTGLEMAKTPFELQLDQLRHALRAGDEKMKDAAAQQLSDSIARHPDALEKVLENISAEADPRMLFALGKSILDTGKIENQKLVTDAALNLLLSDDTSERRKASLEILANSRVLTPELRQAWKTGWRSTRICVRKSVKRFRPPPLHPLNHRRKVYPPDKIESHPNSRVPSPKRKIKI